MSRHTMVRDRRGLRFSESRGIGAKLFRCLLVVIWRQNPVKQLLQYDFT